MMLINAKKSSYRHSLTENTDVKAEETETEKRDLLLEVISSEKLIIDTVNQRFGNNASKQQYSVEHISLSGSSASSISLDINEHVA